MSNTTNTDAAADGSTSRRRRILTWVAGLSIVSFIVGILTPLKDLALAVQGPEDVGGGGNGGGGDTGGGTGGGNGTNGGDGENVHTGLPGQRLVLAEDFESAATGDPVTTDMLEAPNAVRVFPENSIGTEHHLIILNKLEPDQIGDPTNMDWVDQGFVAYSAICTHLGCTVNWASDPHEVGKPHDHCPCHVGEFDPYTGAEVVAGPAPRPLPQIGVTVNDDDEVELTSEFEERVGGEG